MGILVKVHPHVGMTGFTDVIARKLIIRRGRECPRLCGGRERYEQQ
jgi:hypothetical protein